MPEISRRALHKAMRQVGAETIVELLKFSDEHLLKIEGIGPQTLADLRKRHDRVTDPSVANAIEVLGVLAADQIVRSQHEANRHDRFERRQMLAAALADKAARKHAERIVDDRRYENLAEKQQAVMAGQYQNKEPLKITVDIPLCCVPECDELGKERYGDLFCCLDHHPNH